MKGDDSLKILMVCEDTFTIWMIYNMNNEICLKDQAN